MEIKEPACLQYPKFVTVGSPAVQKKIQGANPRVKDFRSVGTRVAGTAVFGLSEFSFTASMIRPVKLVDDVVLYILEARCLLLLDKLLRMRYCCTST